MTLLLSKTVMMPPAALPSHGGGIFRQTDGTGQAEDR
jgi:hypothetical protein